MAIIEITGEGFYTGHQAVLVRDRNAGLNAGFTNIRIFI